MNNLNIPRELFLGLNNHKASFKLLKSQIITGNDVNREFFIMIPVRVIYRTIWCNYSFVITYHVCQKGNIHIGVTRRIQTKHKDDFMALRNYCKNEVYEPCDSLRNYLTILGLVNSNITIAARHGIWVEME